MEYVIITFEVTLFIVAFVVVGKLNGIELLLKDLSNKKTCVKVSELSKSEDRHKGVDHRATSVGVSQPS